MRFLDELLFPGRCPVCLDIPVPKGALICNACRDKLRLIEDPRCLKCGRAVRKDTAEYCPDCARLKRSFVTGIAGFNYGSVPVRKLISRVKYHNERQLLDYPCALMAGHYAQTVEAWGLSCLIPVPLHASRRRARGFNQAEEIARRLGAVWDIPVEKKLLVRQKKTLPQKELDEAARLKNLTDAFALKPDPRGVPLCAAVVDDIYTTGTTMEACTRALMQAGVERVYSIVLAAVP